MHIHRIYDIILIIIGMPLYGFRLLNGTHTLNVQAYITNVPVLKNNNTYFKNILKITTLCISLVYYYLQSNK